MTLVELVSYFRSGGTLEEFCQQHSLDFNSEVIQIFMTKPFGLQNVLFFFEIEKTGGSLEYTYNSTTYYNLYDFYFFQDAIEEANYEINLSFTDESIAKKLYDYALNDA